MFAEAEDFGGVVLEELVRPGFRGTVAAISGESFANCFVLTEILLQLFGFARTKTLAAR